MIYFLTFKITTYIPRTGNEESIKFSYFSLIQTEAIKRMVAGEVVVVGCVRWCRAVGQGPNALFGVSNKNSYGGGGADVADGVSSERCLSVVVGH